jgi:hypothetical membrane protein
MKKYQAWIGITAVLLSTLTIIVMAELRGDYNHTHRAISELGSVGAPHKWIFNMLGYFVPGILVALFAYALKNEFSDVSNLKTYPFYFFMLSGIFLSLAGIFPGDLAHRTSATTIMHLIGSFGGGLMWLICGLTLWWQLKKKAGWKAVAWLTFIIPFVTIILMGLTPKNTPGIAQRIGFAGNYLFILLLAIKQWNYSQGTTIDN